jgi:phytoene synthase
MNVRHSRAAVYAIRLGIAMQLTNIARDVVDDGKKGRFYIPQNWIAHETIAKCVDHPAYRRQAEAAIIRLLLLAETYYDGAIEGLLLLPPRERFAVMLARRLYRQIGRKILDHPELIWTRRVSLTTVEKLTHATLSAIDWLVSMAEEKPRRMRLRLQSTR